MKKTMLLAAVLAAVLALTPCALAADFYMQSAAEVLHEWGVFRGTGSAPDGTPVYNLDGIPTRNQAIIMLLRLLGREKEALEGHWEIPFKDVDPASAAAPYVGCAYSTGLTRGFSEDTFGGSAPVQRNQYVTILLRVLGYGDEDFSVATAGDFAASLGLTGLREETFTRGDLALLSYNAMSLTKKGTQETLAQDLAKRGVIPADAAAGRVIPADSLSLETGHILRLGETETLELKLFPENASRGGMRWSSSAPEIAAVSAGGAVTGLKEGSALITAYLPNGSYSQCQVTVTAQGQDNIRIYKIYPGSTIRGEVSPYIHWRNDSGKDIARIAFTITPYDKNGQVAPSKPMGETTLTFEAAGPFETFSIANYAKSFDNINNNWIVHYPLNIYGYVTKSWSVSREVATGRLCIQFVKQNIYLSESDYDNMFDIKSTWATAWRNADIQELRIDRVWILYADGTEETMVRPPMWENILK